MNRILRLTSLMLALVVSLALVATTTAPAQAQAGRARHSQSAGSAAHDVRSHGVATRTHPAPPRSTRTPHAGQPVKPFGPHVNYMGNDYCGSWWHGPAWCLTFNKVEAGYIAAVSLTTAAAYICGATALITCGVAVGIAAAIQHYVDRNGVCPKSHPKMRVEYIPTPGAVSCD